MGKGKANPFEANDGTETWGNEAIIADDNTVGHGANHEDNHEVVDKDVIEELNEEGEKDIGKDYEFGYEKKDNYYSCDSRALEGKWGNQNLFTLIHELKRYISK